MRTTPRRAKPGAAGWLLAALLLGACQGTEAPTAPSDPPETGPTPQDIVSRHLELDLAAPPSYATPDYPVHYDISVLSQDNTPPDDPVTDRGASLGRVLFHDDELSRNRSVSCASCHEQALGFTDARRKSLGLSGDTTPDHSMRLANLRFYGAREMLWDRDAATLEDQVLRPIFDGTEMGFDEAAGGWPAVQERLEGLEYYPVLFQWAFGTEEITRERVRSALSQYLRAIVSLDSRFDRGFAQVFPTVPPGGVREIPGFTDQENRGFQLFALAPGQDQGGVHCATCHQIPSFALDSDSRGNGLIPGSRTLFKAPSLKNVAVTGPYMHDGRFATLDEVLDHYSTGVADGPVLDDRLRDDDGAPVRFRFTDEERAALLAFLRTLTDESLLEDPRFADPFLP